MGKNNTFRLKLPRDRQVETYTIELADGSKVTRTVDQLTAHPTTAATVNHG